MKYTLSAHPAGILPLPGWECFFGVNDQNFYPAVFYIWVIRGDGCIGIVDTGLPLDGGERAQLIAACQSVDERCTFQDLVPIDQVLAAENLNPEDIDFVAITQPITYSTGGLVEKIFPRAEVFISNAGVQEFLLDPVGHPPRAFYFGEETWMFIHRLLIQDRLKLVDRPTEIRPGIIFETTGGHHPGSAGLRIATEDGIVGILETAFFQRNLDEIIPIGIAEDVAACRRAIKNYKANCDVVVPSHEPKNQQNYK